MNRFKRILVYAGTGASEPALRQAARLAQAYDATVEVVDVVEELPTYARLVTPASWDVAGLLMEERRRGLQDSVRKLEEHGIRASSHVLRGKPAIEITKHVLYGKHDLVLKTAHRESSPQRLWHGVLAKRLIRICPCPV